MKKGPILQNQLILQNLFFFCGYGTNQSYRSSYVQYVTDYTYKCRETFSQTVYADLVQFFGAVTLEYKSRLCTGVLLGSYGTRFALIMNLQTLISILLEIFV